MSRLLPFQSDAEVPQDRAPRVVDLEGEDAEKVFGALSSETARSIFTALHEEPMTASDVADAVDSSIQNVRYHLENLSDAGLVAVVDTWYSSRGNEMKVYAPKDGPLIVSSDESRASRIRTALSRIVGGVGVLAASSLLVQYGWEELFGGLGGAPSPTSHQADGGAPSPTEDESTAVSAGDSAATDAGDGAGGSGGGGAENASGTTGDGGGGIGINNVDTTQTDAATQTEAATQTQAAATSEPTTVVDATETAAETSGTSAPDGTSYELASEATTAAADAATTAASGGDLFAGGLPPGAMFFLGGLVVLLALVAYQYRSTPY